MPDLRMPDFSGRTLMAMVVVAAGVLAMLVALLSGSSSPNSDNPGQSSNRGGAVEPVPPIDPEDLEQVPAKEDDALDPGDPFAISFGKSARREVTIRVTGNGLVNIATSYRDRKKPKPRSINGSFSETRTFKGKYPMASVVVQLPANGIPGAASRATCTITIDGIKVASQTTKKAGYLTICVG